MKNMLLSILYTENDYLLLINSQENKKAKTNDRKVTKQSKEGAKSINNALTEEVVIMVHVFFWIM